MYLFYMFPISKIGWVAALQQVSDVQCLLTNENLSKGSSSSIWSFVDKVQIMPLE